MSAKKLLLHTDEASSGGVAQYNDCILKALVEAGWTAEVSLPPSDSPLIAQQASIGVRHHFHSYNPQYQFARSFVDTADAERIFGASRPDVVFFSDCSPISNIAGKHVALKLGIPFVTVCHSEAAYLAEKYPQCLKLVKYQLAKAAAVIAVSESSRQVLCRHFGLASDKGIVIYNGRPDRFFEPPSAVVRERKRNELGLNGDDVVCFTAARIDVGKGYQYQIEAIALLKEQHKLGKFVFLWAGEGDQRAAMEEAARSRSVHNRIRFLGNRWDIPDLLDASDIFILTSLNEAMPLCVIEAMAKGRPVIATAVGGLPEQLGTTGKLVSDAKLNPDATVRQLADTLAIWSHDAELIQRLGREAMERASTLFRIGPMNQKTLEVLTNACTG